MYVASIDEKTYYMMFIQEKSYTAHDLYTATKIFQYKQMWGKTTVKKVDYTAVVVPTYASPLALW